MFRESNDVTATLEMIKLYPTQKKSPNNHTFTFISLVYSHFEMELSYNLLLFDHSLLQLHTSQVRQQCDRNLKQKGANLAFCHICTGIQ